MVSLYTTQVYAENTQIHQEQNESLLLKFKLKATRIQLDFVSCKTDTIALYNSK